MLGRGQGQCLLNSNTCVRPPGMLILVSTVRRCAFLPDGSDSDLTQQAWMFSCVLQQNDHMDRLLFASLQDSIVQRHFMLTIVPELRKEEQSDW